MTDLVERLRVHEEGRRADRQAGRNAHQEQRLGINGQGGLTCATCGTLFDQPDLEGMPAPVSPSRREKIRPELRPRYRPSWSERPPTGATLFPWDMPAVEEQAPESA